MESFIAASKGMTSFRGSVGTFKPKLLSKTTDSLVVDSSEEAAN